MSFKNVQPGELQNAIDHAMPGDTIVLKAGAVYEPIIIRSQTDDLRIISELSWLTDRRPLATASLPVIASDTADQWPVFVDPQAKNVKFGGLRIRNDRKDDSDRATIAVCIGKESQDVDVKSVGDLPQNIAFEGCLIGDTWKTRVGVLANGVDVRLKACGIYGGDGNHESQAVLVSNTPGPVSVARSEVVGTTENFMAGGSSPHIPGVKVLSEGLEFIFNDVYKMSAWRDSKSTINCKNLFELKNCWLARIQRNRFWNCWADNQDGMAILFTPREHSPAQYGKPHRRAPLTRVGEVLFEENEVFDVDGGISILASDDVPNQDGTRAWTMATDNIEVARNCFRRIGRYGGNGRIMQVLCPDTTKPIRSVNVHDNFMMHHDNWEEQASSIVTFVGHAPGIENLSWGRNWASSGKYGMIYAGLMNEAALTRFCHSHQVEHWDAGDYGGRNFSSKN